MPLTMTAEREAEIQEWAIAAKSEPLAYPRAYHMLEETLAEIRAERAAHQETQRQSEQTVKVLDGTLTQTLERLVAETKAHQETQAKLAGAHENADALLVRLGGDPEGMSDAEAWHASAKAIAETQAKLDAAQIQIDNWRSLGADRYEAEKRQLAETQAIARELVEALENSSYRARDKNQRPGEVNRWEKLIAKAKAVLPQVPTQT